MAPILFFDPEKKIKSEPNNGKKIIKDNIGKFIISKSNKLLIERDQLTLQMHNRIYIHFGV